MLPGTRALYEEPIAALREGLSASGRHEPQSLTLVFRYSEGFNDRLPALARELIAADVDAVVTSSTPAIRAAMAASSSVPIVFAAVADAVASGLVASLARPGGNATGLTLLIPDLGVKQVQLLGEMVPRLERVAVLRGRGEGAQAFDVISSALAARGARAVLVELSAEIEIADAFTRMQSAGCQALIIVDGPLLNNRSAVVARLAAEHRLPAISTLRTYVEAGSLASYGPNIPAMWRRAAKLVDVILRGAKPAELPVEQPTVFELIVNLKTANALGLSIPPAIRLRADLLIER